MSNSVPLNIQVLDHEAVSLQERPDGSVEFIKTRRNSSGRKQSAAGGQKCDDEQLFVLPANRRELVAQWLDRKELP